VILLEECYENVTEIVAGFGEKGVSAEHVAQTAVDCLRRYQASGAVVGEHLADQLLIPFALAGEGEFITLRPSNHSLTNARTIEKFLDTKIQFHEETSTTWRCVVDRVPH
jgi:RNA 3'-terminal phosphate cyclase (ATP)